MSENENLFSFPSLNRNFALPFTLGEDTLARKNKKTSFLWFFARLFVSFSFGEDRLHLGNTKKKIDFFLCISEICTIFATKYIIILKEL